MDQKSDLQKSYPAIALIEFNNLPDGLTAGDAMVKKSPIAMLKSGTVSQGKFLVLIGGSTASVEESFREGIVVGANSVIDSLFLPDVQPQVHQAILGGRQSCTGDALGIVETTTVAAILQIADAGVKGAEVDIVEMRLADGYGGKGYTLFSGKVEEVEAAVDIGCNALTDHRVTVYRKVIPLVHSDMIHEIQSSLRFSQSQKLNLTDGEL